METFEKRDSESAQRCMKILSVLVVGYPETSRDKRQQPWLPLIGTVVLLWWFAWNAVYTGLKPRGDSKYRITISIRVFVL